MEDLKQYVDEQIQLLQQSYLNKDQIKKLVKKVALAIVEQQKPTEEEVAQKEEEQFNNIIQLLQTNINDIIPTY